MSDPAPLVFDPEIIEVLNQESPLLGQHWPNIQKEMVDKHLNRSDRFMLRYLPDWLHGIRLEIVRNDKAGTAVAELYKHGQKVACEEFEKRPNIPRVSWEDSGWKD